MTKNINKQHISDIFPDLMRACGISKSNAKTLSVAVSGGIDSMALVLLANEWAKDNGFKVIGVTVDHQLRPSSTVEALHVSKVLKSKGIEHHILIWDGERSVKNLEALAREARYHLLIDFCQKNDIKYLLTAHHLQDQAETFLIRLFRGSGIDGLSAMSKVSEYDGVKILRPLLEITKKQLKEYLVKNKIQWIEDESNDDERYLRNKIRKFLNSFDADDKFDDTDIINRRIAFASKKIREVREDIEHNLLSKSADILEMSSLGYCKIFKDNFVNLDEDVALRYLAWILMEVSGNCYKPRLEKLEKLYQEIIKNKLEKARTFYGCVIEEISEKQLVVYREVSMIGEDILAIKNQENIWDKRFKIVVGNHNNLVITHINFQELNSLINSDKNNKVLKEIASKKGWEKKIICTLPVLKKSETIVAIPHLDYYINNEMKNSIGVEFISKTKLSTK